MKLAVYGAGGVGGYLGGRLAKAGAKVHLIARGPHLEALRAHGLRVESLKGDFEIDLPATDDPADIGPCDYVLLAVKSFDTNAAAARLAALIGDATAVVSFQNGIENEDMIARVVGQDHVMGGVAYIFSTIARPGVVAHTGGPARFVFGEMDGSNSERAELLLQACREAGIDAEITGQIRQLLWDKFAFICAQAGATAAVRLTIGEIRSVDESWAMFRRIVEEVCSVASAEGIELPEDTAERHVGFAAKLEPGSYSSLHYDLTQGRPLELQALHGTVVRLARHHGIAVPTCETVHAILRPWEVRNAAKSSS